jgi:mannose-6-phosphate isomerase-like protein (cupin superfamily)
MEEKINKIGKTYSRPWGEYKTLDMADNFQCKVISIRPKGKLSLQKHLHRSEHWIIIKGPIKVTKGHKEVLKNTNDHIFIEKEEIHRLENTTDSDVILIEVQIGHYLGEDDIVRLEDVYGRNSIS